MRNDWIARWAGVAAGLAAAFSVPLVHLFIQSGGRGPLNVGSMSWTLISIPCIFGPGLLILSSLLCRHLARRFESGDSRGSVLLLGALIALPSGVANSLVPPLLLFGPGIVVDLWDPARPDRLLLLALGAASGTATGLVGAWRVSRPLP